MSHINVIRKYVNPVALRKAKIVYNFGLSECSRGKEKMHFRGSNCAIYIFASLLLGVNSYIFDCITPNDHLLEYSDLR